MVYAASSTRADEESKRADGRTKHLPSRAQGHRRRGAIKVRRPTAVFVVIGLLCFSFQHTILGRLPIKRSHIHCWPQRSTSNTKTLLFYVS